MLHVMLCHNKQCSQHAPRQQNGVLQSQTNQPPFSEQQHISWQLSESLSVSQGGWKCPRAFLFHSLRKDRGSVAREDRLPQHPKVERSVARHLRTLQRQHRQ